MNEQIPVSADTYMTSSSQISTKRKLQYTKPPHDHEAQNRHGVQKAMLQTVVIKTVCSMS